MKFIIIKVLSMKWESKVMKIERKECDRESVGRENSAAAAARHRHPRKPLRRPGGRS